MKAGTLVKSIFVQRKPVLEGNRISPVFNTAFNL